MCCFSQPAHVSNTRIFARAGKDGQQFLVYAMTVRSKADLAMILPIPTPKASDEKAVSFIALDKYPEFFDELKRGFPEPKTPAPAGADVPRAVDEPKKLEVVEVGSFLASFVPGQKDFARLDEQFRLPAAVWEKLPQYKDWGFAVFQLKKGAHAVHPMAFEFPRADAKKLFFPTVHIHDGTVPAKAEFDHALYFQGGGDESHRGYMESPQLAKQFMDGIAKARGIVDPDGHVYRREIGGEHKNEDTCV